MAKVVREGTCEAEHLAREVCEGGEEFEKKKGGRAVYLCRRVT